MSDYCVFRRSYDKAFISATKTDAEEFAGEMKLSNSFSPGLSYTTMFLENNDVSGKTVILFEPHMKLNGSLLDCLDLHLWCMRHGIDTTLGVLADDDEIFIDCIENLITMYSERYCHYVKELDNVVRVKSFQVPTIGKAVIFDYTTFFSAQYLLKHVPTLFVSNILESEKEMTGKLLLAYGFMDSLRTLNEFAYSMVGKEKYRQKYLLDVLKRELEMKKKFNDSHTLIVCPGMEWESLKVALSEGKWGKDIPNLDVIENPFLRNGITNEYIPDMLFNAESVIYFQSPLVYDRKPRVLLEALYLGIPTEYYALENYKGDGSTMRWINETDREFRLYTYEDSLIRFIAGR